MAAAATGMRPEKSVARSAPIRWIPAYQQTKPTTVTITACHSRATTSPCVGTRNACPPCVSRPTASASTAAIPETVADRSLGPRGRTSGTAITAKPTSPSRAHTEKAMPRASVLPQPCTVNAPAATSSAP